MKKEIDEQEKKNMKWRIRGRYNGDKLAVLINNVVENITYEDAMEIMIIGKKYNLGSCNRPSDAIGVVMNYIASFLRITGLVKYQEKDNNYKDERERFTRRSEYYKKVIADLEDENGINALFINSMRDDIIAKYPLLASHSALKEINDYFMNNMVGIVKNYATTAKGRADREVETIDHSQTFKRDEKKLNWIKKMDRRAMSFGK